jgi:arylsulfatase A-like enzyme
MTGGRGGFDRFEGRLWSDPIVVERTWEFMNEERDYPFLAFVRLTGTHWPYDAEPKELEDLDPCDGKSHAFNEGGPMAEGIFPRKGEGFVLLDEAKYRKAFFHLDPAVRQHTIAHYDAKLRRVDDQIGGLLERMRESGLYERTIVVLTSDHGESFGEHGYLTHGPRVDQPVIHVPMIIRLPSTHPSYATGTRTDIVRTVDILPTVLAANGLPLPLDLDGVDLLPVMGGEAVSKDWAYAEAEKTFVGVDPEQYVDGTPGKHRMIRRGSWKLIYIPRPEDPIYRLYDLESDPGETRDVALSQPQKLAELKALLAAVLVHDTDVSERQRELTESEKEQLRQLGYM